MSLEGTQTVTIIACMAVWTLAIAVVAIDAPRHGLGVVAAD